MLELLEAVMQHQFRDAGAEVAAALAHAVGTPLNVISGRAELIRQDPTNALAQVARIEEQVRKLATGLRQLVDYLAAPDPPAALRASSGAPADTAAPQSASHGAGVLVDAGTIVQDVSALLEPLARANAVALGGDGKGLAGVQVERWHALGTVSMLVSAALRHAGAHAPGRASGALPRVVVGGKVAEPGVCFELSVPGLALLDGWQLDHFQARPAATEVPEFFRTLSICGAVVRGHGGRLLAERVPDGGALVVRFFCRSEPA